MYEVTLNDQHTFEIQQKAGVYHLDGKPIELDLEAGGDGLWHVLHEGKSYTVLVHSVNKEEKNLTLSIGGKKVNVHLSSKMERLLKEMGLEGMAKTKVDSVKAPMPGLIHSVMVQEGDEVKKGDALLILEAMKMENVIKSPTDGVVAEIKVEAKQSVDKNAVLLKFK